MTVPLMSCADDGTQLVEPEPQFTHELGEGSYAVGFTYYMLTDGTRENRQVPVYVWYPVDPASITGTSEPAQYPLEPFQHSDLLAGSADFEAQGLPAAFQDAPAADGAFPLILYTAGWGAPAYFSGIFLTELVRHGYVLAVATHWGDRAAPVAMTGEPFLPLNRAAYERPRDMKLVLSDLLQKNGAPGLLSGVIDPATIYASGWSLGGYTALVLAAGDDGVCTGASTWCGPTAPVPGIDGLILFDPSYQLLTFEEIARVRIPVLTLSEEWNDAKAWVGGLEGWQARGHAAISGRPNYRVDITPTNHLSFSSVCDTYEVLRALGIEPAWGPWYYNVTCNASKVAPTEMRRILNQYVLAFLTHQQSILTPGYALTTEPNVEFFVTERRSPSSIEVNLPDATLYFMHQQGRGHGDALVTTGLRNPPGPMRDAFGLFGLATAGLQ